MAMHGARDYARCCLSRSRLSTLLLLVVCLLAPLLAVGPTESAQAQAFEGTQQVPAAIGIAANQSDRLAFGTRVSSQVMSAQALALFQTCGGDTIVLGESSFLNNRDHELVRSGSVSARSEHGSDFLVSFSAETDPGYRWQVSYCYTETTTTTTIPESCTTGEPLRDYTQLGHPIIGPGVTTCTPESSTTETTVDVTYLGAEEVIHPKADDWIREATENALKARDDVELDKVYWNSSPGYNSRQIIGVPTFFAASPVPLDTETASYPWRANFPLPLEGTGGPGDEAEIQVKLEIQVPRSEWHFAGDLGSVECPTAGRLWTQGEDAASLTSGEYGADVCIVAWDETAVAEDSTINPDNDDDFVTLESVQLIYPYDFTSDTSFRVIAALTADGTLQFGQYEEITAPSGETIQVRFGDDYEFGTEYNGGERKLIVGEVQSYGVVGSDGLRPDLGSAESPWVKWEEDTCQKVGGWFIVGFLAGPVCEFITGVINAHLAALNIVWDGLEFVGTVIKVIASGLWSLIKGCLSMVGDLFSDIKETGEQFLALATDPAGELAEISDTVQQIAGQLANEETRGDFVEKVLVDFGVELLNLDMILEPDGDGWKLQEDLTAADWLEFGGRVACEVIAAFFGKKLADAIKGTAFARKIQDWLDGRNLPDIPTINIPDSLECIVRVAGYARDLYDVTSAALPPAEGNSFPAGTLVLMADGSHHPIEAIDVGDQVLSFDSVAGEWEPQLVTAQWSADDDGQLATATLVDGSTITATDGHLFWVESIDAWVELEDVAGGDLLLTPDGAVAVAGVVQAPASPSVVWELSVSENHNFAVSSGTYNLLVHNACLPRGGNGDNGPAFRQDADGNVTYTYEGDVDIDIDNVRLDADGNPMVVRTDDFELILKTDGTVTMIDADGNVLDGGILGADGSVTISNADGTTTIIDQEGDVFTVPESKQGIVCSNSFPTGTEVLLADGTHAQIEEIRPGDEVAAYDFVAGEWESNRVAFQWSAIDRGVIGTVSLSDGSSVSATDHHKFWVDSLEEWVELDQLQPGNVLLSLAGEPIVANVEMQPVTSTLVWELSVEENHNFSVRAGGYNLLVHNCGEVQEITGPDGQPALQLVDEANGITLTQLSDGTLITTQPTPGLTNPMTITDRPDGTTRVDRASVTYEISAPPDRVATIDGANGRTTTITYGPDGSVVSHSGSNVAAFDGAAGDPGGIRPTWSDGDPTLGVAVIGGETVHLGSGAIGPAYHGDPNLATPNTFDHTTHVEGHAVALMQERGLDTATVSINNTQGVCTRCRGEGGVPNDLAPGQTLNVISPDGNGGTRVQQITSNKNADGTARPGPYISDVIGIAAQDIVDAAGAG